MKRLYLLNIVFLLIFQACETAEDISFGMDHETPTGRAITDSLSLLPGQTCDIRVIVEDNAGLSQVIFSYGDWMIRESVSLAEINYPQSYTFETSIAIPEDALAEWQEELILNDGSKTTITQRYHKLLLEATDKNMNVKNIPVYIHVEND
ncbi:MAG: hypothetical protein LBB85_06005 [Dysgonamonadaceae bacterium]|nr:hypothetical protein [Dysgonamonadaceae bacterium]